MKHIILGTAGHVDHGKTALVRRMTGVDTDRLKEEKARGITIDLGFASFLLPGGQRVGIVDVPGHEKFIRNMLAGATGIDLVLFVVAANEGVMPQTREHMDILRLLGVDKGVVALTKTDMADGDWLALVREDLEDFLKTSPLHDAPVVELSSVTGEGIPALLQILDGLCARIPERPSAGICRLAVDRVFSMSGFGTVVTGTLWSGSVRTGDLLELTPAHKPARVRSLQVHGEKRELAYAGERVALNLSGVEKSLAERGSWLATPDILRESRRMDIRLDLLPGAPKMRQHARVHVHHGTAEALARVNLLDRDALLPGDSCFARLELETPLAALSGDRVILRFYSPLFTVGGGRILDPAALRQKRRFREALLARLEALDSGDPRRVLSALMAGDGRPRRLAGIASCLRLGEDEVEELLPAMTKSGELLCLPEGFYFPAAAAETLCAALSAWLSDYLAQRPLRSGAPKQEAANFLFPALEQKEQRLFFQYFDSTGQFTQDEKLIRPAGWIPRVGGRHEKMIAGLRGLYGEAPYAPPAWSEAMSAHGIPPQEQGELLQWFLHSGELVVVSEDAVYTRKALDGAEKLLRAHTPDGSFSLAEARDLFGTTRKYAQQIGEYFDREKRTYREGERRYWKE